MRANQMQGTYCYTVFLYFLFHVSIMRNVDLGIILPLRYGNG